MPFWKSLLCRKSAKRDARSQDVSILDTIEDDTADEIEDLYSEGHTDPKKLQKMLREKNFESPGIPAIEAKIADIKLARRLAIAQLR
ncbi:MAG: hypothetical protein LQ347_003660 [Umbilicaria vellea]|nr:MAG: hypothetical protein LQ347_003660 [Umbilicaria vellea]